MPISAFVIMWIIISSSCYLFVSSQNTYVEILTPKGDNI